MPNPIVIEWLNRAKIDYIAPFTSLWLACNAWYMDHYSELRDNRSPSDRDYINYLKQDNTGRNHLYKSFIELLEAESDQGRNFRNNLEMLHNALYRAEIQVERLEGFLSFERLCTDFTSTPKAYINIIKSVKFTTKGAPYKPYLGSFITLNSIHISNHYPTVFAGVFETIYQIRNYLVHGHLNPQSTDELNVVKHCYFILAELMS